MNAPILVLGSTGTVGKAVVAALLAHGAPVRVLVRDVTKAKALFPASVEFVAGDLNHPETLAPAFAGIERVFLLTSSGSHHDITEKQLIDLAKQQGVRRIVNLSVVGAALDAPTHIARAHARTEAYLRASGLEYTNLQPSYFMHNFLGNAAYIAQGSFVGGAGEGAVSMIDVRDIADAAVEALVTDNLIGQDVVLTGPAAVTFPDAAKSLAETIGRPVAYVDLPSPQFHAMLIGAGLPAQLAEDLTTMNDAFRAGYASGVADVQRITGRPGRTFASFATDHAAVFRG